MSSLAVAPIAWTLAFGANYWLTPQVCGRAATTLIVIPVVMAAVIAVTGIVSMRGEARDLPPLWRDARFLWNGIFTIVTLALALPPWFLDAACF